MAADGQSHEKDKIGTLREDVYSRSDVPHAHDASRGQKFTRKQYDLKDDWTTEHFSTPETLATSVLSGTGSQKPFPLILAPMKLLLAGSILFFLFAVGITGYVFFSGSNTVSTENVNIIGTIPVSVSGGEEVPIALTVENYNSIDLESVDLTVTFPEGTKKAGDVSVDLKRYQETLGVVPKNGKVSRDIKAVFFGEENSTKKITVSIEYRVKDSNARLVKEKEYELFLKTSPLSMSVQGLKEIQSGQDIDLTVNLTSNSNLPLKDLLLKVEYPFGFEFKSGSPAPTAGKNIWRLNTIQPTDKKTIRVRGKITGQNEEDRVFRVSVGIQDKNNEKNIGTVFLSVEHVVRVKRPFVGLNVAFNGEQREEYVARPGSMIRADVLWANNLQNRITDAMIEVSLMGNLFNPLTVNSSNGFYRSSDNKIIWDQTSDKNLSVIEPSAAGNESFGFALVPSSAIISQRLRNPEMKFTVSVKGKRISETSVPEEINALITRKVKMSTEVSFAAKTLHTGGAIPNRGPVPPIVNQETTYTIVWSITNTSNSISGGEARAFLPSYVTWLGAVTPSQESLTFQPVGGLITWDVGDVESYTGFTSEPREVSFQVALTPSLSQLNQIPVLVRDATFKAVDDFTGVQFNLTGPNLTTDTPADPQYVVGSGAVVQ